MIHTTSEVGARYDTVIVDVDGTLVDTNYHHALAWYRAFRRFDLTVPVWRIHRSIGMGGDQLVAAVTPPGTEDAHGDDLRSAWEEEYQPMLDEVRPFDGARRLLQEFHARGLRLVLASSGKADQVDHYLDLLDARELADAWTTSDEVQQTKPAPDLVQVALDKVSGASAIMIGDSVWDVEAAAKLGIATIGLRTGGYSGDELTSAGALAVHDTLDDLRENLDDLLRPRP